MKNLVWLAGGLLALSFVFPDGLPIALTWPKPAVVDIVPPTPAYITDEGVTNAMRNATQADRNRVYGLYEALAVVLERDRSKGPWIKTTEQWAEVHGRTLDLAIDKPGTYPGLDVAIERVFTAQVGTDDVVPNNAETRQKLIDACHIVAASAVKK